MTITINIPDSVSQRMIALGITKESIQEEMIIDFINDSLDLNYHNGLFDKFKKWTTKKDNIEVYLENSK